MKLRSSRASLIAVLLFAASCGDDSTPPPPGTTGSASLQISDGCGTGALAGAIVLEGATEKGTTDATGSLELTGVPVGAHTYTVSKSAYVSKTVQVSVADGQTAQGAASLVCQTKAVGDMARAFTARIAAGFNGVMPAATLQGLLADGNATNDPIVISVRAQTDYATLGHVPGAINIPWKTVADDPVGRLGEPDPNKPLVDYCYTGHTGAIAAGVLNVLGYKTSNMKFGITSWTKDTTAWNASTSTSPITLPDYYCDAAGDFTADPNRAPCSPRSYGLEQTVNVASTTYGLPTLDFGIVASDFEAARKAAQAYLAVATPTIGADALNTLLTDGDTANDPFIISIRGATDYAAGHIPGAINIPYSGIADDANLRKIPTDRDIVVYCYTGHTGGIATAILGTLGYHKVKNLRYGMFGWNAAAPGGTKFSATDLHAYPVVTGTLPGTWPAP